MRLDSMVSAVDLHACGEPGRVIIGGVRDVPGRTMFEKMQHLARHQDDLRKRMLREPRGYPAANCNLVLPPTRPDADAGFVIMEQVEYPPMSGTNTICVTTALLETGMIAMREPVTELTLEAPAGLIRVRAECRGGKVTQVAFRNVPAFAVHLDRTIEVRRYHLPDDWLRTRPDRYRAVELAGAQETWKQWIKPDQLTILVVGDAATIRPGLEGLGLPITVLDADGRPVK